MRRDVVLLAVHVQSCHRGTVSPIASDGGENTRAPRASQTAVDDSERRQGCREPTSAWNVVTPGTAASVSSCVSARWSFLRYRSRKSVTELTVGSSQGDRNGVCGEPRSVSKNFGGGASAKIPTLAPYGTV